MIPYGRQLIEGADLQAVTHVLTSDWLTQEPEVEQFETELASAIGAQHVVAVSSGTAALHMACLAAGVSPGDVVLTAALTFVASANCALYCGGDVAFVDVDPVTITMAPESLEQALSAYTRRRISAVIPVDFAGHPAALEAIHRLAHERGALVIEDACHA